MKASFLGRQLLLVSGAVVLAVVASACRAEAVEVDELLITAQQPNSSDRYESIDLLGQRAQSAETVVPVLVLLLDDQDESVRWRAARSLGDFGDQAESAVSRLVKLLKNDEEVVQMHAAAALGRIGDSSAATVDALVEQITDEDAHVARVAIDALRNLKPDPSVVAEGLAKALESNDQAVTSHALQAIVEADGQAVPLLRESLARPQTAYLACVAIGEIGPPAAPAVPDLVALLKKTSHSQLEIQILLALAKIGPDAKSAAPEIESLLTSSTDSTVPAAAAHALGEIGATDSIPALKTAAANKDNPFLEMVAAWSLAKLQPSDELVMLQAVGHLTKGLESDDPMTRMVAAKGLVELKAPPEMVVPALHKAADDPDPEVRANVLAALTSLGEMAVPGAIRGLQNPEMEDLAVKVLTRLGPEASAAVQPLVDAMSSADAEDQGDIQVALAAIGPAAAPATEALVDSLSSDTPRVQHTAFRALHDIGPGAAAAKQPLLAMLGKGDSVKSVLAAWTLSAIAPQDSAVSEKILPVLIEGLGSPHWELRVCSAEGLATLGPAASKAIPQLTKTSKGDEKTEVRAAAEAALAEIPASS